MPSSVIAQVAEIKDLRKHPDADRLELATLGGWQIVCGKDLYKEGERVVYITPDTLITEKLADILEIKQHLQSVKNSDGTFVTNENGDVMLRVRQAKLRGEPSFGTTIPVDVMQDVYGIDINAVPLGANLATALGNPLGLAKYEPQMRASAGDAEEDHPLFVKYTSIENLRNFPNVLEEGETVTITEKLHGTNCRVGNIEGQWMAGSHGLRRKEPENYEQNTYWYPLSLEPVKNLINAFRDKGHRQVILFGEVFGNVQKKYNYGIKNGIGFRAFDLLIDGKYVDAEIFDNLCEKFEVPMVPKFHTMAYNYDNIVNCVEAYKTSTMSEEHPMEGVVIKPRLERNDRKVGRVVLKYITNKYLFDKGGSDFTDF